MIRALNVANNFLVRAFNEDIDITPMKLQKLIYILYKTFYKRTRKSLFKEEFEVWKYGPVLISVYDEFKEHGGDVINRYYTEDYYSGELKAKIVKKVDEDSSEEFRNIIDCVWKTYKNVSAVRLSGMTHLPGGAWDLAKKEGRSTLLDEHILNESDYK